MPEVPTQSGGEIDQPLTLEERIARCPIHAWRDIAAHMESAGVPENLRPLLDELLVVRGEYAAAISADDSRAFGRTAETIMFASGVEPAAGRALYYVFSDIVRQWLRDELTPRSEE